LSAAVSHIPRTLAKLRTAGVWEKVEQWVTFAGAKEEARPFLDRAAVGGETVKRGGKGFKRDFMGFADILGLDGRLGVHAVQVCARSGLSAHLAKIDNEDRAKAWLLAGNRLTIWTWEKKENRWQSREVPLCLHEGRIVTVYEKQAAELARQKGEVDEQ
jgi:hypothetical protein